MTIKPRSRFDATLPLPPSVNNLFATYKGRRIQSREYKAWLGLTAVPLMEMKTAESTPVEVHVSVFGKVNKLRDLDNMLKPIGDALVAAGVIPGDSLKHVVGWRIAYKGESNGMEPCVLVQLANA